MVNSIFNGWRIDTSGSTNKRANAVQRRTVFEQNLLAVTNVWGRPALPNSSSPPKVHRETIAELCHLLKSVHAGLRRAVDEIAQEGMRALGFARGSHPPTARTRKWRGLRFEYLALAGIADPLRPTSPRMRRRQYLGDHDHRRLSPDRAGDSPVVRTS